MKISRLGDFVVTGSHDRSIRRWQRSEEPFFVDEEKEKRLAALFEGGEDEARWAQAAGPADAPAQLEGVVETSARKTQVRRTLLRP